MIVITKDQDFISLQLAFGHVVLWLRCGNMNNLDLYAWLAPRWAAIETALVKGDRLVEVRLIG
jgi:predicted nuclease of predicted toxin-antitoxin system